MNASMFHSGGELKVELNERNREGSSYYVLSISNDKDTFTIFIDNIVNVEMLSKEITKFLVNR